MNDEVTGAPAKGALNEEALRRKYQAEREKRLRADGSRQYHFIDAELRDVLDDPYVKAVASRETRGCSNWKLLSSEADSSAFSPLRVCATLASTTSFLDVSYDRATTA